MRSVRQASSALDELAKFMPDQAERVRVVDLLHPQARLGHRVGQGLLRVTGDELGQLLPDQGGEHVDLVDRGHRHQQIGLLDPICLLHRSFTTAILPSIDLVDRIQEIHADPALGLTLFVADDRQPEGYRTVTLGFDDFDAKYATLQKINAYLKNNHRYLGFRSIDLNNPDRIVVNPVPADTAADVRKEV